MKEFRCRDCGQVFQVAEIPGERVPDPVQCPACLGDDVEPLFSFVPGESPPPGPASSESST